MNGIFIYYNDLNENSTGIDKKVISQIKVLNENHLNCNTYILPYEGGYIKKFLHRLPFSNSFHKWKYDRDLKDLDYVYLRRPGVITLHTINFLRKVKRNNPECKIILEIPTYPYDKEYFVSKRNIPLFFRDKFNRRYLKRYVNRIVTFNKDNYIFGIPTIKLVNGFDFNNLKVLQKNVFKDQNIINIIAVASMEEWHGYERIIRGLNDYYKAGNNRDIRLHFVGHGSQSKRYIELTKKLDLADKVLFHGNKYGKDLQKVYNLAEIAIETLACHRKGIYLSSSLKSREYLAKGLPMITSTKIDILPDNYKYVLKVSENDDNINMHQVLEFYDSLNIKANFNLISKEIRKFGEQNADMNTTMIPLIEYIQEG